MKGSSSKSPAFQLYAAQFLAGTADMTAEEVGAYIRLLCQQWLKGGLPDDESRLSVMAGCTSNALAFVLHKFSTCEDGELRNEKLESVRADREKFVASRAGNARKRWEKRNKDALASKKTCTSISGASSSHMLGSSPSSSSSSSSSSSNSLSNDKEERSDFDSIGDDLEFEPAPAPPPKPRKKADPEVEISASLNTPEFVTAWTEFIAHRKEIKKPMTPMAMKKQMNALESLGPARAIAAINHSIRNGWQGIFEPDSASPPVKTVQTPESKASDDRFKMPVTILPSGVKIGGW